MKKKTATKVRGKAAAPRAKGKKREPCGGWPKVCMTLDGETYRATVNKETARSLSVLMPGWKIDPKNKAKF